MHVIQGNLETAVEVLEPALALCRSAEFPIFVSRVASSLGAAYASLGRVDEALVLLEEAIRQGMANKLLFGQSLVLLNFGRACHLAGRQDDALTHAQNAIQASRASGERGNEAWACYLTIWTTGVEARPCVARPKCTGLGPARQG
jgi:tetratricopeptide (TPR) repeat protein